MDETTEERNARLIARGDIVRVTLPGAETPQEEVVRDVSVILHLANGADVRVGSRDSVTVVHNDEISVVRDEMTNLGGE